MHSTAFLLREESRAQGRTDRHQNAKEWLPSIEWPPYGRYSINDSIISFDLLAIGDGDAVIMLIFRSGNLGNPHC